MVAGINDWGEGTVICRIKIVGTVRVLGVHIDRKLEKLDDNFDLALMKMERYTRY
jgi:hypothetical protein